MTRLYMLTVRGRRHDWAFPVEIDPRHLEEWREDGLVLDEALNIIPQWWVDAGLPVGVWCFFQDLLNFRSPV